RVDAGRQQRRHRALVELRRAVAATRKLLTVGVVRAVCTRLTRERTHLRLVGRPHHDALRTRAARRVLGAPARRALRAIATGDRIALERRTTCRVDEDAELVRQAARSREIHLAAAAEVAGAERDRAFTDR